MAKLKKNDPIHHIMVKNPVTIEASTKISDAHRLFYEHKIHHLPVVSGEKLLGIFSYSDMLRLDFSDSFGEDPRQVLAVLDSSKTIQDVMVSDVVTLDEKDTVHDAATKLCKGDFHALPVVADGRLKGIVTSTDIIRYLADLY